MEFFKWIILLLHFLCCCSGQVLPTTSPPTPLKVDSSNIPGTIFTVNHPDAISYHMLEVYLSNDSVSNTDFTAYKDIALNTKFDDCNIQLTGYPAPRSYFCIDHTSGQVKAQPELSKQSAATYVLSIHINTANGLLPRVQTIEVVDYCLQLERLESEAQKSCQIKFDSVSSSKNSEGLTHSIKIDLPKKQMYLIQIAGYFNNNRVVIQRSSGGSRTLKTTSSVTKLPQPLIISSGEIFNVSVIDASGKGMVSNENRFGFNFMPMEYWCSSILCRNITRGINDIPKNNLHCEPGFGYSPLNAYYGPVCEGIQAPTTTYKSQYDFTIYFHEGIRNQKIISGPISSKNSFQYTLNKIVGQQINSTSSKNVTTCAKQTNGVFSFLLDNQFCMNTQNGDIYVNDNFGGSVPKEISFEIKVANVTYPYTATVKIIRVTLTDKCSPIGDNYGKISSSQCTSQIFTAVISEDFIFDDRGAIKYLGIEINKNVVFSDDAITAVFEFSEFNTNIKVLLTFNDLQLYKGLNKYIEINETQNKQFTRSIDFYGISISEATDSSLKTTRTIKYSLSDIKLFYITTLGHCDNEQCLVDYKAWKASTLGTKDKLCQVDPFFLKQLNEPCLDLKPDFGITGPSTIVSGSVIGCPYVSTVNLNAHAYFLVNGTHRMNTTGSIQGNIDDLATPSVSLTSYTQKGTFQCAIYDPVRMTAPILSPSSKFLQLPAPVFFNERPPNSIKAAESSYISKPSMCTFIDTFAKLSSGEVLFLKDGKEEIPANFTSNRGRISVIFHIDVLKKSDAGAYQCVLHPKGLSKPVMSSVFNVTVLDLSIEFTSVPSLSRTILGVDVTGCEFNTNGNITNFAYYVFYSPSGNELGKIKSVVIGSNFKTIFVEEYKYAGAFYACQVDIPGVTNTPITSNKSAELQSYALPEFTISSDTAFDVFLGNTITLPKCVFTSMFRSAINKVQDLNANITYMKDGKKFRTMKLFTVIPDDIKIKFWFGSEELVLKDVSKTTEGNYTCAVDYPGLFPIIIARYGHQVKVYTRKITITSLPKLKENRANGYMELLGCNYTVSSLATIQNFVDVTMLYNGQPVQIPSRKRRAVKLPTIQPIVISSYDQVGNYTCKVSIGTETVTSKIFKLETLPAPTFTTNPVATYGDITGGSLQITGCAFDSLIYIDRQYVSWYKNGYKNVTAKLIQPSKRLTSNYYGLFDSLSYSRTKIDDQGLYQCAITLPDGRVVLSAGTKVQFLDVSWTNMRLSLNKPFLKAYSDKTSNDYKVLENDVISKLTKVLTLGRQQPVIVIDGFKPGSVIVSASIMYGGISTAQKIDVCRNLGQMKQNISGVNDLEIQGTNLQTQDCCPISSFGEDSFKGVYSYPVFLIKSNVALPCQYDPLSTTTRVCSPTNHGASWKIPDLSKCPAKSTATNDLISLSDKTICSATISKGCSSVEKVSEELADIVNDTQTVTTHQDVEYIASIIQTIVGTGAIASTNTTVAQASQITNDVFDCIDNVVGTQDTDSLSVSQVEQQTLTSILESIDTIAAQVGGRLKNENRSGDVYTISKTNIAMSVNFQLPNNVTVSAMSAQSNSSTFIIDLVDGQKYDNIDSLVKVRIPAEVFQNNSQVVHSVFYKSDTLFRTPYELLNAVNDNGTTLQRQVNSNILKVSVGGKPVENLVDPVLLTFRRNDKMEGKLTCEFWNLSLATEIPNVFGQWSESGCSVDNGASTANTVACKCDHMTNFAILLDVSQTFENPLELQIVTWIGCGISLAGLFLTLLTYILFRDLRKKLPPKILISLCFSLMSLLIIFLAGAEATTHRLGCQIVAGMLQYFMLTTFCWMAVEGVNLYRNFVTIFDAHGSSSFFLKASIFAWGLPLGVVIATASANPDNLGNENFCVVVGYSFYFAILMPIAAILLGNFVVLVMVMRSLHSKERSSLTKVQEKDLTKSARIAFGVSVLLGTTWIFGLLAVGDLRVVFQWLFTILNACQGFFIFIFYTFRNPEVRKKWKKRFPHVFGHHGDGHSSVPTTSDSPARSYKMSTLSTTDGKSSTKSNHSSPIVHQTDRKKTASIELMSVRT